MCPPLGNTHIISNCAYFCCRFFFICKRKCVYNANKQTSKQTVRNSFTDNDGFNAGYCSVRRFLHEHRRDDMKDYTANIAKKWWTPHAHTRTATRNKALVVYRGVCHLTCILDCTLPSIRCARTNPNRYPPCLWCIRANKTSRKLCHYRMLNLKWIRRKKKAERKIPFTFKTKTNREIKKNVDFGRTAWTQQIWRTQTRAQQQMKWKIVKNGNNNTFRPLCYAANSPFQRAPLAMAHWFLFIIWNCFVLFHLVVLVVVVVLLLCTAAVAALLPLNGHRTNKRGSLMANESCGVIENMFVREQNKQFNCGHSFWIKLWITFWNKSSCVAAANGQMGIER